MVCGQLITVGQQSSAKNASLVTGLILEQAYEESSKDVAQSQPELTTAVRKDSGGRE